jgi:hypothetical protein
MNNDQAPVIRLAAVPFITCDEAAANVIPRLPFCQLDVTVG